MDDAKAIEKAWAASTLGAALPQVARELDEMMNTALLSAFQNIARGDLTPDAALTTLIQLKSFRDLKLRLQSKAGVING